MISKKEIVKVNLLQSISFMLSASELVNDNELCLMCNLKFADGFHNTNV